MSQVVQGVIDNIYTKEVNTKFGPKPVYIAQVGGQEVNLGFKTPLAMGETVSLNVEHKYGSLQLVQGTPTGSNGAVPSNGVANAPAVASGVPITGPAPVKVEFPVDLNSRGTSIIRQNSMVHATKMVDGLIAAGLFKPATEADYTNKVIELAGVAYDFSSGQGEVKQEAAMAAYNAPEA